MKNNSTDFDFDNHFRDRFENLEVSDISEDNWAEVQSKLHPKPFNFLKYTFVSLLVVVLITTPVNKLIFNLDEPISQKKIIANSEVKNEDSVSKNNSVKIQNIEVKSKENQVINKYKVEKTAPIHYDASLSYRTHEGRQQTLNRPIGHSSVIKNTEKARSQNITAIANTSYRANNKNIKKENDSIQQNIQIVEKENIEISNSQTISSIENNKIEFLQNINLTLKSSFTVHFDLKSYKNPIPEKQNSSRLSYYLNFIMLNSNYSYSPNQQDDIILSNYQTPKNLSTKRFGYKAGTGVNFMANQNFDFRFGVGFTQLRKSITYNQNQLRNDTVEVVFKDANTLQITPIYQSTQQQEFQTYRFANLTAGAVFHFKTERFTYYTSIDAEWNYLINYANNQNVSAIFSAGIQRNFNLNISYRVGPVFMWNFNQKLFDSEKLNAKTNILGVKFEILFNRKK